MLKYISSTYDYRDHLKLEKSDLSVNDLKRLASNSFRSAYHKLWKLDIDLIHDLLIPLYSPIGRPAIDPAVLIRSFLLMQHFGVLNIHDWVEKIKSDALLQFLIWSDSPPSVSSHYDFISRLTGVHSHRSDLLPKGINTHDAKSKRSIICTFKSRKKIVMITVSKDIGYRDDLFIYESPLADQVTRASACPALHHPDR